MSEKRLKIGEFSKLVGCSAKAIYGKISDPEKKELITDIEVINGREVTVIVTNDVQIKEYQKMYGKLPVNDLHYEDILTDNESKNTSRTYQEPGNQNNNVEIEALSKAIDTLNMVIQTSQYQTKMLTDSEYNLKEEYFKVNAELQTLQIRHENIQNENEILKKDTPKKMKVFIGIITVITMLFIISLGFLIYKLANPTIIEKQIVIEKKVPVTIVQKPIMKRK